MSTRTTRTTTTTAAEAAAVAAEETTTTSTAPSAGSGRPDPGAAGAYVGRLFAEHGRMVLGLCRLLLRDPLEAEDAAQQTFLSAHRSIAGAGFPRDPPAWLAAIARNECRARIRLRMREPLVLRELPNDLPDPLARAIRNADLEALWKALAELPRRQRRAFLLRELGGLSYGELGAALGVSRPAVESLLFRARRQLRALLAGGQALLLPAAMRDRLGDLIPSFDPGTASLVGRVAALPVTAKLATATVGVGLLASGAAKIDSPPVRHADRPAARHSLAPVARHDSRPARVPVTTPRPAQRVVSRRIVAPADRPALEERRSDEERGDDETSVSEPQERDEHGRATPERTTPERVESSHDEGDDHEAESEESGQEEDSGDD